ncbi:MAG TPA: polysaccharide deacetylase family protein [Thermomicrobiales bacterium]|nr:polysaccharide deacetylase family protein [Thermomicrobiales bacterium]
MKDVRYSGARTFALAALLLLTSGLTACGSEGDVGDAGAWQSLTPTIESPVSDVASSGQTTMPPAMGDMIPPAQPSSVPPTMPPTAPASTPRPEPARRLTTDQLKTYQPNELGVIPVLQYHVFVTDPEAVDQFTMTIDTFTEQLQWLYDHDFYVISMADFLNNTISAPAGKRPVVRTFDDGTAGQFRFIKGSDGNLVPDPDSAVGVMEAFYAEHPDFGRGGFFAVLPFNCFAEPNEPDQMPFCERKLTWLAEHGYEVGNHTAGHQDLLDVTDERFMSEVAEAARWIDERVPEPGNLSQVLVMPYGNYPDADLHPEQRQMMREGFEYDGMHIRLQGAFMVGSNPAESPSSALWDPIWIPRIQTFEESMKYWFTAFEDGNAILYVSDGNLDTVTVPDPLPPLLVEELDPDLISESGKELIQYGPEAQASTD